MSADYPQAAIRMQIGQGRVLPFVVSGTEETDYGTALVAALGTQTESAKTILLDAYTFDCGDSELDDTHLVYGVGATATRIKSSLTKAELADFAKRCFRLTIEASDGEIVRDLEPNDDGEFVANIIPTAATREEIDEMLGPEGLLVIGTDDDSINRLDGETPGGKRLGGVIGKIEVRPEDGSPGRSYYGDNLTDTLTEVLGVAGNFVEVWGEIEYEDTGSELFIDIADGVTFVNHGYIHATEGGTHPRCFRVPAGRTVKVFNDGLIVMVGVGGDPIATHGAFIVAATARLLIDGTTDISNLGISFGTKAVGRIGAGNGWGVLIQGVGGQAYVNGNHFDGTIRADSGAFLVVGPRATYAAISDGGGVILRGKIFNTAPGTAFLSLIDDATAADIRNTAGASGGIFPSSAGGTGNAFTKFTGPTTSEKTFTLPNSNATLLHGTPNGIVKGDGTGGTSAAVAGTDYVTPEQIDNSALALPPYVAGRYYPQTIGIVSVSASNANTNQRMYLVPWRARQTCTVDAISVNIPATPGGASDVARLGVYGSSNGQPDISNVIRDASTVSISTGGVKTNSFTDLTIQRGELVYLAVTADDTTVVFQCVATSLFLDSHGSSSPGVPVWNYHVAGVDPDNNLPTAGSVVASGFVNNCPVVWLRVKSIP